MKNFFISFAALIFIMFVGISIVRAVGMHTSRCFLFPEFCNLTPGPTPSNSPNITGDVFASGSLGGVNIGAKSVIAANVISQVNGENFYQIDAYKSALWDIEKLKMDANIVRLIKERATPYSQNKISGNFNLNPLNGNPTDNNFASVPEGQVWHISGNFEIGETTFSGKGTIIVDGDVNITGNVKYSVLALPNAVNSLGIIANNIIISQNVVEAVGAYYASGKIQIK